MGCGLEGWSRVLPDGSIDGAFNERDDCGDLDKIEAEDASMDRRAFELAREMPESRLLRSLFAARSSSKCG